MPSPEITVLVADDHPLALEGVRSILSKASDIKIIGEAQDGQEIKPLVVKLHPQVLLLDLRMPNLSPVELGKWVQEIILKRSRWYSPHITMLPIWQI